jgi:hypothetical protein
MYPGFLGAHASSVHEVSQVHARCVRSQEASSPLCFLVGEFFVAAIPLQVNSWNSWQLFFGHELHESRMEW